MTSATQSNLLLVGNNTEGLESLSSILCRQGFNVRRMGGEEDLLENVNSGDFDIVFIAIDRSGLDGLHLVREVRLQSDIGIIALSGDESQLSRIACLEWGADDCITTRTSTAEVIARTRALCRRLLASARQSTPQPAPDVINISDCCLDIRSRHIRFPSGERAPLTHGEFVIIQHLASNLGRPIARSELMNVLSGGASAGTERTVDVLVSRLRHKLGDNPKSPRHLMTVHGVGYRLVGSSARGEAAS